MLDERRRILNMLAEGKISASDADGLLAAMADIYASAGHRGEAGGFEVAQVPARAGGGARRGPLPLLSVFRSLRSAPGAPLDRALRAGLHDQINKALEGERSGL